MNISVFWSLLIIGTSCLVIPGCDIGSISTSSSSAEPAIDGNWPPKLGARYPDLQLTDQNGNPCKLSDFSGKTILLELAAVPCKGCQAFAGGNEHGGFAGVAVQSDLDSIHTYVKRFAGFDLEEDDNVVLVQLLLYGKAMGSPTEAEVSDWAEHFKMDRDDNEVVLKGEPFLLGNPTYQMIPGFHLIDQEFVLRCDSSGHNPKQNLYRDLLPLLGKLSR